MPEKKVSRYDSQANLDQWVRLQRYPKIHDDLFALTYEEAVGRGILDLCGSTGLMGARIKAASPFMKVLTIDMDAGAIARGKAANLPHELMVFEVKLETLPRLERILTEFMVEVVVARRCLSELFVQGEGFVSEFALALRRAEVRQIFAEGRRRQANSTHPFPSIDEEVEALQKTGCFKEKRRRGECSFLVAT